MVATHRRLAASRDTPTNQALPLINHPLREEGLPTTKQTLSHIDILQKRIVNGVFYYPAFFEGGNNDPANAFVLEVNGSREVIPIPGTCLYIYVLMHLNVFARN